MAKKSTAKITRTVESIKQKSRAALPPRNCAAVSDYTDPVLISTFRELPKRGSVSPSRLPSNLEPVRLTQRKLSKVTELG